MNFNDIYIYIYNFNDPSIEWCNNLNLLPDITFPDIFNYVILTKSAYILDEFESYKSLEACNFLVIGRISNVKW